jgi:acyl homoserine lactone synthase
MIRFLYADQLKQFPILANSMFMDRAEQFKARLNWSVSVDENGWELDEYDALNPLYVIWEEADGRHGGSMRTLPTVGRTMVAEHFRHLTHGVEIASPLIWECTRFCLAPSAKPGVAAALLLAGCEMGLRFGLEQAVGVFDARMPRIYGRIGWMPDVIGTDGTGRDAISVGLWNITAESRTEIACRAGIPLAFVANWFDCSFRVSDPVHRAAA